jgi:hypothetical protein
MQPAGSKAQVKCSWSFQQVGAAAVPQSSSAASNATSTPAGGAHPTLAPAGASAPAPAPTPASASGNQTLQAPGAGGNYRTPTDVPPPATPSDHNAIPQDSTPASPTDCNQVLADVAAQYQAMAASIELMYAKLLQDNEAQRAQINGYLATLLAGNNATSDPSVQALIKALRAQVAQLEAERAKYEDDQRKELADTQKEADRAELRARGRCEAGKASP